MLLGWSGDTRSVLFPPIDLESAKGPDSFLGPFPHQVHTSIAEVARPISITSTTPLTASLFQHLHHLAGDRVGDGEPAASLRHHPMGLYLCVAAKLDRPCLSWVIRDRCRGSFLPVDVRFAPKATEVLRCREMTRRATKRHHALS
jgi:hypothetical protein